MINLDKIAREIADKLIEEYDKNKFKGYTPKEILKIVDKLKKEVAGKYGVQVVKNSQISKHIENKNLKRHLIKVPSRTISGVTPVAIMSVSSCPHGKCLYCPKGKCAPQSYTGEEPASLRARQNMFDPYMQVKARLRQYKEIGHPTDKIELIVMGGTFLAQNSRYKKEFILKLYEALNGTRCETLEDAKKINETALHRVVGLTIETRPDWSKKTHINEMLNYGSTRVELGVQTLSDSVYKKVKRGHEIKDVVESTQLLKDSAFKIVYHMMPGLFCSPEEDIQHIKSLFVDPNFQPDMLKIYPTLVLKNTELYDMWERGEYKPYDSENAAEVISEALRYVPKYVRVMRIQRDIPSPLVVAGVKHSNLRQIVEQKMKEKNIQLKEIRSREIGVAVNTYKRKLELSKLEQTITEYKASNGKEYFIAYEDLDDDVILGFVRLRIPYAPFRPEIDKQTGLIRELHVYGSEVGIGGLPESFQTQHRGLGKNLLEKAEEIAKQNGMEKMIVIAGSGVRPYYYKQGYSLNKNYVGKKI